MKADLPQRARAIAAKYKQFPEAGMQGGNFIVRGDAFMAFLDWRKLQETEILDALDELARLQQL